MDEDTLASASITIAAPPERVYDLVADVTRMGEWSPEASGTIGQPSALQAGDKFWGTNRKGFVWWFTRCTVRRADRGERFEFDVDFSPSASGSRASFTTTRRRQASPTTAPRASST